MSKRGEARLEGFLEDQISASMNRETLDGIVKAGLLAYANELLMEIGREATLHADFDDGFKWAAGRVQEREVAQAIFLDDKRRLEIVDRILKEMK